MTAPTSLAARQCIPCRGDTPPLAPSEVSALLSQVTGWEHEEFKRLRKSCRLKDFASALEYVNRVGAVAEDQGHHPNLYLAWGKVEATVWTHKIDGLKESDFIFAAKMDALYETTPGRK